MVLLDEKFRMKRTGPFAVVNCHTWIMFSHIEKMSSIETWVLLLDRQGRYLETLMWAPRRLSRLTCGWNCNVALRARCYSHGILDPVDKVESDCVLDGKIDRRQASRSIQVVRVSSWGLAFDLPSFILWQAPKLKERSTFLTAFTSVSELPSSPSFIFFGANDAKSIRPLDSQQTGLEWLLRLRRKLGFSLSRPQHM